MEKDNKKITIDDLFANNEDSSKKDSMKEMKKGYSIDDLFGSSTIDEAEDLEILEESIGIPYDNDMEEEDTPIENDSELLEISKMIDEISEKEPSPSLSEELEEIEKEVANNKIKISIIIILILLIGALTLFFLVKNNTKDKKKETLSNSAENSVKNLSPNVALTNEEIMQKYGEKAEEKVNLYFIESKTLPNKIPTVFLEGYTVSCEIEQIYDENTIYLGSCSINESEAIYSYGEWKENQNSDTNLNSNSHSNSNENVTSNKQTNSNSNKQTNVNKPTNSNSNSNINTNTNTNTNSNSNTNSNINKKPQMVTDHAITSSSGTRTVSSFGTLPVINENIPFTSDTKTCKDYASCYSGNDGKLTYNTDRSLLLGGSKAPILIQDISSNTGLKNQYSMNMTIQINANQYSSKTIASISVANNNYLAWIGYHSGNLYIASYQTRLITYGLQNRVSFSNYNNKVVNIQVVAKRGGKTKIYINGEQVSSINSGNSDLELKYLTIGDTRLGANEKASGSLYEFVLYDKELSADEIKQNYEAAKANYSVN